MPAELAILHSQLRAGEDGVWLNSRGYAAGVVDLVHSGDTFKTRRAPVPEYVGTALSKVHASARVAKGCPDLVIWNTSARTFRLIEVKCPHWDRPSEEQERFMQAAEVAGIPAEIVEWEFEPDDPLTSA